MFESGKMDNVTIPIEAVLGAVCARVRGVRIDRLTTKHPADDDNLWFISRSPDELKVQIESHPDGQPPFQIEGDGHGQRVEVATVDEAIRVIQAWLA